VEGAQDSTLRKRVGDLQTFSLARFFLRREFSAKKTKLRKRKRSSASGAPSTTVRSLRELQWSPSPAVAGADGASSLVLATHLRPSFADQSHEAFASKKK
jgi:hypothetical protein